MELDNMFDLCKGVYAPHMEGMQRIDLKDSCLICPDDWIWLDVCDTSASTEAIVIEFYNGPKFDLPHFVFALDGELTADIEIAALDAAAEKSRKYKKLRLMYPDPRFSGDGRMLNAQEIHEQPVPAFFKIAKLGIADSYPCGAVIIERRQYEV